MTTWDFQDDPRAVSPVIGVILMVAITVVVASIVFVIAGGFGQHDDDKPRVVMVFDDRGSQAGGVLTVLEIHNGPVDVANVVLGGSSHSSSPCSWSRASGNLAAGDQLLCDAPGTITITEITFKVLLYSNTFN